eukprot:scaffold538813_cov37-Prasinocladus_malaysianus.AAC.1
MALDSPCSTSRDVAWTQSSSSSDPWRAARLGISEFSPSRRKLAGIPGSLGHDRGSRAAPRLDANSAVINVHCHAPYAHQEVADHCH